MTSNKFKRWLPLALCCLPGVFVAAVAGIGVAVGGSAVGAAFGGPLGLGLIALALLACPLSMGLMMWRRANRNTSREDSTRMADCCAPGEDDSSAERLAALRAQREALERELAELQTQ